MEKTNDLLAQREYVLKHCFLSLDRVLLVPHRPTEGDTPLETFAADQYDSESGQLLQVNRFSVEHTVTLPVVSRFQVEKVYNLANLSDARSKLHLEGALRDMGQSS